MNSKPVKRSLMGLTILFGATIFLLLLWEVFPAAVLGPYNYFQGRSVTVNGQAILETTAPEYISLTPLQEKICFKQVEIDPDYHSEGASIADINRDGLSDIVTGHHWYQAPDWRKHTIRAPDYSPFILPKPSDFIKRWFEQKYDFSYPVAFYTFHRDIDQDGWVDVITVDQAFSYGVSWFKNPGAGKGSWEEHRVINKTLGETPLFVDVLGNGAPQVVVAHAENDNAITTLQAIDWHQSTPVFNDLVEDERPPLSNINRYHGMGYGDINGDGLADLVAGPGYKDNKGTVDAVPAEWLSQHKTDNGERYWTSHQIELLPALSDIHVMDINNDGRADLVGGVAHDRGLFWFERGAEGEGWIPHVIDDSYTQLHSVITADINGDGENNIVSGKTAFAHGGVIDPDEFGAQVLYWYEKKVNAEGEVRFVRHLISETVGTGRQITAGDINADGLTDVVVGNRNGVHLLLQYEKGDNDRCY